jgi:hypothetical protein
VNHKYNHKKTQANMHHTTILDQPVDLSPWMHLQLLQTTAAGQESLSFNRWYQLPAMSTGSPVSERIPESVLETGALA